MDNAPAKSQDATASVRTQRALFMNRSYTKFSKTDNGHELGRGGVELPPYVMPQYGFNRSNSRLGMRLLLSLVAELAWQRYEFG